ncbi:MAG: hypothetical protein KAS32_13035 [Candidatus Peribacteraceae bacterium]|nr:hypothetical protein [Candidatus Peribacteraceae bacterium]
MSIKLTKTIAGKKVELDIISLGGAVVRNKNFKELEKEGITKEDLEKAGFGVEPDTEA